MPMDAGIPQEI
uniref:Uncharacterized protein n=1 Tax=Arundo donax TaxID=35708 RepID=A0A0A9F715_ARUDO